MRSKVLVVMMAAFAAAGRAGAQERGRVGITMGYPASVGVLWQVADRVALRPEGSFSRNSNEFVSSSSFTFGSNSPTITTTTTSENTGNQVGAGLSALFYLWKWDALRAYVSPRVMYSHGSNHTMSVSSSSGGPVTVPAPSTTETMTSTYFISGSFGAQYALGSRFGLYGEMGFGGSRTQSTGPLPGRTDTASMSAATRSGVGAVFYF